jgi:hypothetical protein
MYQCLATPQVCWMQERNEMLAIEQSLFFVTRNLPRLGPKACTLHLTIRRFGSSNFAPRLQGNMS